MFPSINVCSGLVLRLDVRLMGASERLSPAIIASRPFSSSGTARQTISVFVTISRRCLSWRACAMR